jgi:hypothetical protein
MGGRPARGVATAQFFMGVPLHSMPVSAPRPNRKPANRKPGGCIMSLTIGAHRFPGRSRSNAMSSSGPSLLLDVPVVGQARSMSCWYASACMVAYFHEAGPRLGLPRAWEADHGISISAFPRLAAVEGLVPVPLPSGTHAANNYDVFQWLLHYGPLWAAGDWYGFGHVIVITGIESDTVHINDPDDQIGGDAGRRGTETVTWFNDHLWWDVASSLMYKPAP